MFAYLSFQGRFPGLIHNARGSGTFCAIDSPTAAIRDALITSTRNKGESLYVDYNTNRLMCLHINYDSLLCILFTLCLLSLPQVFLLARLEISQPGFVLH